MSRDKFQTILVITVGFILIGFFAKSDWPFYVAFGVGSISLISNRIAQLIINVWFGIARVLGYVNSRILLTIIYYLFLVPLAMLSRLNKNRTLDLKRNDISYFTERNHFYKKSDFEKPW